MEISKFFKNIFLSLLILATLIFANLIKSTHKRPDIFISKQDSSLNLNFNFLNFIHVGHKRLLSSLYWVATILESDIDHYKAKDLNSWMFLRFNTISKLEPKFLPTYTFGGLYLSIIKDDLQGSSALYDKGLSIYPSEYKLLSDAGFHYYYEVGDLAKAKSIYGKLKNFPELPITIATTISRLEAQDGNLEDAYNYLTELSMKHPVADNIGKKIFQYRYSIKAELDLDCLNRKNKNCSRTDLEGNEYLFKNNQFIAPRNWIPFRSNKKN